jgi:hypothetical protein
LNATDVIIIINTTQDRCCSRLQPRLQPGCSKCQNLNCICRSHEFAQDALCGNLAATYRKLYCSFEYFNWLQPAVTNFCTFLMWEEGEAEHEARSRELGNLSQWHQAAVDNWGTPVSSPESDVPLELDATGWGVSEEDVAWWHSYQETMEEAEVEVSIEVDILEQ